MPNDYIAKFKSLSPELQAKLSDEKFLARLDELDEQYGVKAVLIIIGLLVGEIDYGRLADKLIADYGFNDFLAQEVKKKFGDLIKDLGESAAPVRPPVVAPKQETAQNAPMVFSQADEDEVKKYINVVPEPKADYASAARKVLGAFGYQGADEVMLKRLENIIIARLRDVRDDLETRENLMKSKKVGGMELAEAEADRLIGLINNRSDFSATASAAAFVKSERIQPRSSGSRPRIEMEDGLPVVKMPLAGKNAFEPDFFGAETLPQPPVDDKMESAVALPQAKPRPYIAEKIIPESVLNAKTASRPNLDDVKLEKKLMGPIEELENMTIIDFRRLADNPQAATSKIKEKIDLLEKDGFSRKISGIIAWQGSEVSRFYRLLGQLSMSEGRTIEDVIKERLIAGKPTLSLDEFHAVMELNRVLRY